MKTMTKELQKIGERIRKIRKNNHLTQSEMVENLNCGRANYSRIEKGDIMPGLDLMFMLYHNFNISLDWLLTGKGKMGRSKISDIEISNIGDSGTVFDLISDIKNIPLVKFAVLEFYSRYKLENIRLFAENGEEFLKH